MNNQGNNNTESNPKPNIQRVYSAIKFKYEYIKVKCYSYLKEKGINEVYWNEFVESEDGSKIKKYMYQNYQINT